jgi:multidrug resistance efflux pump
VTKYFSIAIALIGIFAAVSLVRKIHHVDPPAPPLKEPTHAPFAQSIGARGIIESVEENVRVAAALPGVVTKVFVKVGDRVEAGAALFEQDQRDAAALVQAQEAQVALNKAQIEEAAVTVADKKDTLQRIERLSANRVSSEDERQRAFFATQAAEARLASMRSQLEAANALLARNRVQIELLTTRAPRAGQILQVNTRPGEFLASEIMGMNATADPPILLGQTDHFQLRADVDEDNAVHVRPGATAFAYIKGQRDNPIPLTFVRIEPYVVSKKSLTGESSERVDTRVLQVIYRFNHPEVPVYVGQQMDVFIDGSAATVAAGNPAKP